MRQAGRGGLVAIGLAVLSACSSQTGACGLPKAASPLTQSADAPASAAPGQATGAVQSTATEIAILGDSVTAGLGLMTDEAYPSLIQRMFAGEGYNEVEIV